MFRKLRFWGARALVVLLCLAPAATAQTGPESPADKLTRQAFSANLFVFFHELGHGLVSVLQLPVVGKEEDVVDEFATYFLIRMSETDPSVNNILADAVESWRLSHVQADQAGQQTPYWDEHGLDLQRYYNILCFMYGANPAAWNDVRLAAGIPDERADRCVREYAKKRQAWDRLLEPHMIQPGAIIPAERGKLIVSYPDVKTDFSRAIRDAYQKSQIFEYVTTILNETYILPASIDVTPGECGMENAFWDPLQQRIVMCYELVAYFMQVYGGSTQIASAPQPPAQQTPPPAAAFTLVGAWQGDLKDNTGQNVNIQVIMAEDGRYHQTERYQDGSVFESWGQFTNAPGQVAFDVQGWRPVNFCKPGQKCQAVVVEDYSVGYQVLDANRFQTSEGGLFQRMSN